MVQNDCILSLYLFYKILTTIQFPLQNISDYKFLFFAVHNAKPEGERQNLRAI